VTGERALDRLTVDDFRAAAGHAFALSGGGAPELQLELLNARTHPPGGAPTDATGTRTPFAVRFRGPADPVLPQRIYRLEHRELGVLEVFLVPIGSDERGTRYEAVFA
jgi:hypothetical protein